ncbi:hypothetical protein [Azospirillum sp. ST 5-10]|uniref:hypothetical protein n=1 Tax=unclassified Azospirillum TaxID=2630922 RepID=UPI003F49FA0D
MRQFTVAERARIDAALAGYPFRPLGVDEASGLSVWPIAEYLARAKHTPRVAERIARLNATGKVEGERPRGWFPHQRDGGKRDAARRRRT